MATLLGMEAVINYKVGGQGGGGAWTELTNVKDVTLNLETSTADVTTRANSGWRATVAALKDATVEFVMVWDTEDAGFSAIQEAFLGEDADARMIGFQVLDQASGQGLQADFNITNFSRSEPLEEAITVNVSAKITRSDTAPTWIGA